MIVGRFHPWAIICGLGLLEVLRTFRAEYPCCPLVALHLPDFELGVDSSSQWLIDFQPSLSSSSGDAPTAYLRECWEAQCLLGLEEVSNNCNVCCKAAILLRRSFKISALCCLKMDRPFISSDASHIPVVCSVARPGASSTDCFDCTPFASSYFPYVTEPKQLCGSLEGPIPQRCIARYT